MTTPLIFGLTIINSPALPLRTIHTDVTIIGGGIAGLWLLNRLRNDGYTALLFEHQALGGGQTVASQGMIHGGIKYTLNGALSGASEAIAGMPEHWRRCLRGEGDVDLRGGQILSDHFYLWSAKGAAAKLTTFLASKATRGRVDRVRGTDLPALLKNPRFKGSVYKLVDMVLDVPSLIQILANRVANHIYLLDWQRAQLLTNNATGMTELRIAGDMEILNVTGRAMVLTAGQGNEALLQQAGATLPIMQRRPLQQVMVKHRHLQPFYGHCLGTDTTPRLTISSHPCADGGQVWYLGGALAEKGVDLTPEALINNARNELAALLPWVELCDAQWATLAIDRAEPRQRNLARPDQAFADWATGCSNVIAAWPTKLTLAPNLSTTVIDLLQQRGIRPDSRPCPELPLPGPPLALAPWQQAFGG